MVGVPLFSTTFQVSKPPYQETGKWKMVVDGVELTKIEEKPKHGQMLVGFLRKQSDSVAQLDPAFASLEKSMTVIDLDEFAQICEMTK